MSSQNNYNKLSKLFSKTFKYENEVLKNNLNVNHTRDGKWIELSMGKNVVVRMKRKNDDTFYELIIEGNTVLEASCNRETKKYRYYLEAGKSKEINERISKWDTWIQMRSKVI